MEISGHVIKSQTYSTEFKSNEHNLLAYNSGWLTNSVNEILVIS